MYYEVYIENLLITNFVMNLAGLLLVNRILLEAATLKRILLGAGFGALFYLLPMLLPGPGILKLAVLFPAGMLCMLHIVFPVEGIRTVGRIFFLLLAISFTVGGAIEFLVQLLQRNRKDDIGLWRMLGLGSLVYLGGRHLITVHGSEEFCRVELIGKDTRLTVRALIDSGNGLTEPFSGKPVCVVDREVFDRLWQTEKPEGIRVIPYHSVGCSDGVLYSFPVPQLRIHKGGLVLKRRNVYVGVSPQSLAAEGGYSMLLNPLLLKPDGKIGRSERKI